MPEKLGGDEQPLSRGSKPDRGGPKRGLGKRATQLLLHDSAHHDSCARNGRDRRAPDDLLQLVFRYPRPDHGLGVDLGCRARVPGAELFVKVFLAVLVALVPVWFDVGRECLGDPHIGAEGLEN